MISGEELLRKIEEAEKSKGKNKIIFIHAVQTESGVILRTRYDCLRDKIITDEGRWC